MMDLLRNLVKTKLENSQELRENPTQESSETATITSKCPFGYDSKEMRAVENQSTQLTGNESKEYSSESAVIPSKLPFGYDSETFKIGPLSCIICQALYLTVAIASLVHVYCKVCLSHFKNCPLCGADIKKVELKTNIQTFVDRFIEGHARIKRSQLNDDLGDVAGEKKRVIYEDVSLERGYFLVQQVTSHEVRKQLERMGSTSKLCSHLGAVLGTLVDCCRASGDAASAIKYFKESVDFLSKVPKEDLEVTNTLSIYLNKIGDLNYYGGDQQTVLDVRNAVKNHSSVPSQVLDIAISLAKVADVDRNLGYEDSAVSGIQEAIRLLESLTISSEEVTL